MEILKTMFAETAIILGIVFMIALIIGIIKAIFAPITERKARQEFEEFLLSLADKCKDLELNEENIEDTSEETTEEEQEETEEKEEE